GCAGRWKRDRGRAGDGGKVCGPANSGAGAKAGSECGECVSRGVGASGGEGLGAGGCGIWDGVVWANAGRGGSGSGDGVIHEHATGADSSWGRGSGGERTADAPAVGGIAAARTCVAGDGAAV